MYQIETILFVNPTEHTINLDAIGLEPVAPKGEVAIPLEYAAPTRNDNGNRGKSVVEQVAPQLRPKSDEDYAAWKKAPAPPIPQSKIVTVAARPASEAPGVKALREARQKATVSPKPNVSPPGGKA